MKNLPTCTCEADAAQDHKAGCPRSMAAALKALAATGQCPKHGEPCVHKCDSAGVKACSDQLIAELSQPPTGPFPAPPRLVCDCGPHMPNGDRHFDSCPLFGHRAKTVELPGIEPTPEKVDTTQMGPTCDVLSGLRKMVADGIIPDSARVVVRDALEAEIVKAFRLGIADVPSPPATHSPADTDDPHSATPDTMELMRQLREGGH